MYVQITMPMQFWKRFSRYFNLIFKMNCRVAIPRTGPVSRARLVNESLHLDVVNDVDCSVLLAERPSERSIRARLFGAPARERHPARAFRDGTEAGVGAHPGDE